MGLIVAAPIIGLFTAGCVFFLLAMYHGARASSHLSARTYAVFFLGPLLFAMPSFFDDAGNHHRLRFLRYTGVSAVCIITLLVLRHYLAHM